MGNAIEQCKRHSRALLRGVQRFISGWRRPPEDPYSYVTAPKKPRPPYLSATAVADRPDD